MPAVRLYLNMVEYGRRRAPRPHALQSVLKSPVASLQPLLCILKDRVEVLPLEFCFYFILLLLLLLLLRSLPSLAFAFLRERPHIPVNAKGSKPKLTRPER